MNIYKVKRILFISLMITILVSSSMQIVYAATASELQQQQNELDKQIEKTASEIAGVKEQMTEQLTKINQLNSEISNYDDEISDLQTKIDNLTTEISQKQASIEEQEEKYAIQKELLDKRLIALYESGSTSYLDLLLSSDGLSDFISKYYIISTIAESDQELLNKIETIKNQIIEEKAYLVSAQEEIITSQSELSNKKNLLENSKSQKQAIVSNLSAEEKVLQEQLDEFEEDKKQIQRDLAALAAKNGNITPVAPSAAGYISPLAGKTKANITTGYGSYSWGGTHSGVDFSCAAGTAIYAVKSGTVVISTALRNSRGAYKSYGEYVVIDHHDGTMTLYAHMYSGSRMVSPGQSVSQGQQIGKVGSTGNSTGNHLHFEVRINGKPVNPTPYLP